MPRPFSMSVNSFSGGRLLAAAGAWIMLAGLLGAHPRSAAGQDDKADRSAADLVSKAYDFLASSQAEDGSFSAQAGPAVTAIVATGLLKNEIPASDPVVAKALKYLESFAKPDGGIYKEGTFYKNYETSLTLICFAEANKDGKYDNLIGKAEGFLKGLHVQEGSADPADMEYGGAGYGRSQRPDLSNTSTFIDALKAAGKGADDEAMQRALTFISRCQNLESEYNTTKFAAKVNDGGMYYTPAAGGQSQAGETEDGGLKSYGSMTYAGLKSMIYAGVKKDDPRVKAAFGWIKKNYSLEENPGMGRGNLGAQGLYYYYQVFAKALDALEVDTVEAADGEKHNWRKELLTELAKRQKDNGSWVNSESDRWLEGDPNLVTGYALLALGFAK